MKVLLNIFDKFIIMLVYRERVSVKRYFFKLLGQDIQFIKKIFRII